jgi:ribosomal protein S18 acetylase RimI-like enzyme
MIRFISTEDTLAIRNKMLREGKLPLDKCRFAVDDEEGAFHLGYYEAEQLVCIATFHPQNKERFAGKGYQLRGMATLPEFQGKGIGNRILNFAIVYLRGREVNYLWCNARKAALKFYMSIGFEIVSDEFEIPGVGPHREMYLKIQ